ncbi:MAG: response regulator transcription factor [Saprospiraceae bacterium]|nr:response regulator transcription factor [Saprospiraceae bacterium]
MSFRPSPALVNIALYGISLAALLLLMRWLEFRFMIHDHSTELYIGLIALMFTGLGIWLAVKLATPKVKEVVVERITYVETREIDVSQIEKTGLTKRELEILNLMAGGKSNQEIAETIFISLSTVKTHVASIFAKLDVKRRTQAIEKAKSLQIIL